MLPFFDLKHDNMNFIKSIFHSWLGNVASFASIIGLIIVFISNDHAVIIALSFFCFTLIMILCAILYGIKKLIYNNYQEEYKKISSFFIFQTDDGVHSTFETYRLVQCKRPILSEIEYKYKWTGSIFPRLSSRNQIVKQLPQNNDPNVYDKAVIKFPKPLTYNETTVLHIKTENDDVDGVAKPRLECKVTSSIEIMQFRILLAYKEDNYNKMAYMKRRRIDSETTSEFEVINSIAFDQKYKQYFYVLINPAFGYVYRLEWEK